MIRHQRQKTKFLLGVIGLMRHSTVDLGRRTRAELVPESPGHCDLCGRRSLSVGRLLASRYGIGFVEDRGEVRFEPFLVEDTVDGMYLLCLPCFGMLDDPERLVSRILQAHDVEVN
jgi:hypothetical protein